MHETYFAPFLGSALRLVDSSDDKKPKQTASRTMQFPFTGGFQRAEPDPPGKLFMQAESYFPLNPMDASDDDAAAELDCAESPIPSQVFDVLRVVLEYLLGNLPVPASKANAVLAWYEAQQPHLPLSRVTLAVVFLTVVILTLHSPTQLTCDIALLVVLLVLWGVSSFYTAKLHRSISRNKAYRECVASSTSKHAGGGQAPFTPWLRETDCGNNASDVAQLFPRERSCPHTPGLDTRGARTPAICSPESFSLKPLSFVASTVSANLASQKKTLKPFGYQSKADQLLLTDSSLPTSNATASFAYNASKEIFTEPHTQDGAALFPSSLFSETFFSSSSSSSSSSSISLGPLGPPFCPSGGGNSALNACIPPSAFWSLSDGWHDVRPSGCQYSLESELDWSLWRQRRPGACAIASQSLPVCHEVEQAVNDGCSAFFGCAPEAMSSTRFQQNLSLEPAPHKEENAEHEEPREPFACEGSTDSRFKAERDEISTPAAYGSIEMSYVQEALPQLPDAILHFSSLTEKPNTIRERGSVSSPPVIDVEDHAEHLAASVSCSTVSALSEGGVRGYPYEDVVPEQTWRGLNGSLLPSFSDDVACTATAPCCPSALDLEALMKITLDAIQHQAYVAKQPSLCGTRDVSASSQGAENVKALVVFAVEALIQCVVEPRENPSHLSSLVVLTTACTELRERGGTIDKETRLAVREALETHREAIEILWAFLKFLENLVSENFNADLVPTEAEEKNQESSYGISWFANTAVALTQAVTLSPEASVIGHLVSVAVLKKVTLFTRDILRLSVLATEEEEERETETKNPPDAGTERDRCEAKIDGCASYQEPYCQSVLVQPCSVHKTRPSTCIALRQGAQAANQQIERLLIIAFGALRVKGDKELVSLSQSLSLNSRQDAEDIAEAFIETHLLLGRSREPSIIYTCLAEGKALPFAGPLKLSRMRRLLAFCPCTSIGIQFCETLEYFYFDKRPECLQGGAAVSATKSGIVVTLPQSLDSVWPLLFQCRVVLYCMSHNLPIPTQDEIETFATDVVDVGNTIRSSVTNEDTQGLLRGAYTFVLEVWAERHKNLLPRKLLFQYMCERGLADTAAPWTCILSSLIAVQPPLFEDVLDLLQRITPSTALPRELLTTVLSPVLIVAISHDRLNIVWALLDSIHRFGAQADRSSLTFLIKRIRPQWAVEDKRRALATIDSLENNCFGDSSLFAAVVDALSRLRDLARLRCAVRKFISADTPLNAHTYGTLIKAYGRCGEVEKARAIWHRLVRSHELLPGGREHEVAEAGEKVESAEAGARTTSYVYGCMLDMLVSNGALEEAIALLEHALKAGCEANTIQYSILIKGCAQKRLVREAFRLYEDMRRQGIPCNGVTYNTLINACAAARDMRCAELVARNMAESGTYQPDVITYSTLIKGFCEQGDVEWALEYFERMQKANIKPDTVVFNTLLEGCTKSMRLSLAQTLFTRMLELNVAPSSFTLTTLVRLLGRAGLLDKALHLAEELPKRYGFEPDAYVFTSLITACLINANLRQALTFFDIMKTAPDLRASVSSRTFGTVIVGCIKGYRPLTAYALVRDAVELYHLNLDRRIITRLGQALRTQEKWLLEAAANPYGIPAQQIAIALRAVIHWVLEYGKRGVSNRAPAARGNSINSRYAVSASLYLRPAPQLPPGVADPADWDARPPSVPQQRPAGLRSVSSFDSTRLAASGTSLVDQEISDPIRSDGDFLESFVSTGPATTTWTFSFSSSSFPKSNDPTTTITTLWS